MHHGFEGLCEDFLAQHPKYYIVPVRISGSAIETVFSSLKYISGGNLSSINYASSQVVQKERMAIAICQ